MNNNALELHSRNNFTHKRVSDGETLIKLGVSNARKMLLYVFSYKYTSLLMTGMNKHRYLFDIPKKIVVNYYKT